MEKIRGMINEHDIEAFKAYQNYDLTLNEYQRKARETAIYPAGASILYPALGLAGEAGEVANKAKKIIRDNKLDREGMAKELGDCLWYIAALAKDLGYNMSDIAQNNLDKLDRRKRYGTIKGEGDDR
jgi:NTP pyrophosphatase (non-canonical NTP hydrolase)